MTAPVRPAVVGDARPIVDVRIASWRATYGPHLPAEVWDELDPAAMADRFAARLADGTIKALVAEVDGTVQAYAIYAPSRGLSGRRCAQGRRTARRGAAAGAPLPLGLTRSSTARPLRSSGWGFSLTLRR